MLANGIQILKRQKEKNKIDVKKQQKSWRKET